MEVILLGADGQVLWSFRGKGQTVARLGKPLWDGIQKQHRQPVRTAVALAIFGDQTSITVVTNGTQKQDTAAVPRKTDDEMRQIQSQITVLPAPCGIAAIAIAEHCDARIELLSRRELQILAMFPHLSRKAIARRLGLASSTVDTVVARAARKLGLKGPQLAEWCYAHERILAARSSA